MAFHLIYRYFIQHTATLIFAIQVAVVLGTCIKRCRLAQHQCYPLSLVDCVQREELVNMSGAD